MSNTYRIALITGETVGPELMRQAEKVLHVVESCTDDKYIFERPLANSASVDLGGPPLPAESLNTVMGCQAVLYGTLSAEKYLYLERKSRPEYSMNIIRDKYKVFCNMRRIYLPSRLKSRTPLKAEKCFDILCVRDLSCGLSSAAATRRSWVGSIGKEAVDEEYMNEAAAERCAKIAFEAAMKRNKKVTSLDKASLNDSSVLWRTKITEISKEYPEVELSHNYIDTAAMDVIVNPDKYDVIVTLGAYGDILMDELTALSGVASALGSAELSESRKGIYTPNMVHCPYEWMAGKGVIYPICIIDAVSLMFEYSLNRPELAQAIRSAADKVISSGNFTGDIWQEGDVLVSTDTVGDMVAEELRRLLA